MKKNDRHMELVENVEPEEKEKKRFKPVELKPRNFKQRRLLAALRNDEKKIVFATGPAGTGKTFMATLFAVQQLQEKNIEKIVITRPAVSVDEQHGFLPGGIEEKMMPWLGPIIDVLEENYRPDQVKQMIADKILSIEPLAYMRGRTFKNAIVILDEAQNTTASQMKMITTRLGEGSRLFITGDGDQYDRGYSENGLADLGDRLKRIPSTLIAHIRFTAKEVERSAIVSEMLKVYEDEDKK